MNSLVPGHAFKNNISFLEVHESVLQTLSSSQIQKQFYAVSVSSMARDIIINLSNFFFFSFFTIFLCFYIYFLFSPQAAGIKVSCCC